MEFTFEMTTTFREQYLILFDYSVMENESIDFFSL